MTLDIRINNAVALAWEVIRARVREGDRVVDATVGNGHDTVKLARLVGGAGCVYGFDVQEAALAQTREKLLTENLADRATLVCASHARLREYIPSTEHGNISAIMFNLGFLPGGDKGIVTSDTTTVAALESATDLLATGGLLSVVGYTGHDGGSPEVDAVLKFASELDQKDFDVVHYRILNRSNHPPQVVIIQKR